MIFRVLFHLIVVRFFINFLGFIFKLAVAGLIIIALQVVVGEKSLEEHLETFLKQSALTYFVQVKWRQYVSPAHSPQRYQMNEDEDIKDESDTSIP